MLSWRILRSGLLFSAALPIALGQEPQGRFDALKNALSLTDAQLMELQLPPIRRTPGQKFGTYGVDLRAARRDSLLDDSQRAKLAVIEKVLNRRDAAAVAIDLGLIRKEQWPGGGLCPASNSHSLELDLTPSQIARFKQLREDLNNPLPHELAVAVLDSSQKAKLSAFENELELARQAIQLFLITRGGDPLCQ